MGILDEIFKSYDSLTAFNPALALYRRSVVKYSDHVVCVRGETE